MTISEALQGMIDSFNPQNAKGVKATVQLVFTGEGGGNHVIKIAEGKIEREEGLFSNPTVTMTCSTKDWLDMVDGKLDSTKAFMTGKLKVAGDLGLMMKFQKFFKA